MHQLGGDWSFRNQHRLIMWREYLFVFLYVEGEELVVMVNLLFPFILVFELTHLSFIYCYYYRHLEKKETS